MFEMMMNAVAKTYGLEAEETIHFCQLCDEGDIEAVEAEFTRLSDAMYPED